MTRRFKVKEKTIVFYHLIIIHFFLFFRRISGVVLFSTTKGTFVTPLVSLSTLWFYYFFTYNKNLKHKNKTRCIKDGGTETAIVFFLPTVRLETGTGKLAAAVHYTTQESHMVYGRVPAHPVHSLALSSVATPFFTWWYKLFPPTQQKKKHHFLFLPRTARLFVYSK